MGGIASLHGFDRSNDSAVLRVGAEPGRGHAQQDLPLDWASIGHDLGNLGDDAGLKSGPSLKNGGAQANGGRAFDGKEKDPVGRSSSAFADVDSPTKSRLFAILNDFHRDYFRRTLHDAVEARLESAWNRLMNGCGATWTANRFGRICRT
jgi:hypothetical protein